MSRAEIKNLQKRAEEVARAGIREDIANGVSDCIYLVIAVRQVDNESFALGSYISHTTAMEVQPDGVRKILQTALDTLGHEIPN